MKTQKTQPLLDVSHSMASTIGMTIGALVMSFSTHHIIAPELPAHRKITVSDLTHHFEREREVLHAHTSFAKTRYPVVGGAAD